VTIERVDNFTVPAPAASADPTIGEQLAALAKRLDDFEHEAASVSGLRAQTVRIRKLEDIAARGGNGAEAPTA
jgi:hypothetical protein